ncbi:MULTISPECIES: hypothetical protein [Actinomadura]|uniref:Uncharacterized protein n=1 Tax=Actinomadura yumaensis TaxID=111807 RepID=A0ABW2CU60_9ACTN|nr:hypothetical protein [Actinomadura sp. J1-007]MWK39616.1 hypothetical protein [Actinomadura sp. J1-007]
MPRIRDRRTGGPTERTVHPAESPQVGHALTEPGRPGQRLEEDRPAAPTGERAGQARPGGAWRAGAERWAGAGFAPAHRDARPVPSRRRSRTRPG